MKTPKQWTKDRDFQGGEYDTTKRLEALIAEVQADARADLMERIASYARDNGSLGQRGQRDPVAPRE